MFVCFLACSFCSEHNASLGWPSQRIALGVGHPIRLVRGGRTIPWPLRWSSRPLKPNQTQTFFSFGRFLACSCCSEHNASLGWSGHPQKPNPALTFFFEPFGGLASSKLAHAALNPQGGCYLDMLEPNWAKESSKMTWSPGSFVGESFNKGHHDNNDGYKS